MEIIFVRHAETKNNVSGIIQGPEHGDINEKGEKEIESVSELLKDEKINMIYSSDIPRCKITVEGINKFHNLPIKYTQLIREKYNGDWTGKNYKDVNWNELDGTFETRKVNNGESLSEVRERARKFILEILGEFGETDSKILVVSHGAFLKILIGDLIGVGIKNSIFNVSINHCSPIHVKFKEMIFENKVYKNVPVVYL